MDVNRAGCTKGATLAEWVARQGLTRDEVMAVGDNFNDREMLEYAGVPVVMGNAVAELKQLGWPVTLDNDYGGVAAAIERFVFGVRRLSPIAGAVNLPSCDSAGGRFAGVCASLHKRASGAAPAARRRALSS